MVNTINDKQSKCPTVDVVIPVYMPGREFILLLDRLFKQSLSPDNIFVVNTEKNGWDSLFSDEKRKKKAAGINVTHITKAEFDHAGSRNMMMRKSSADLLLVCTMDALPGDEHLIEKLAEPFISDEMVAIAYARQLPKKGASPVERLSRQFNYPGRSSLKSREDVKTLGIKTYFCSDVCAMYRRSIFEELGGFEEPAIFNEDMVFAHSAVENGYRIAYCADALVYHSHNYSGIMQLRRNFDNGVSQALHPEVFGHISSEKEGIKMIRESIKGLAGSGKLLWTIPLIWQSGCKYAGFFLGKRFRWLPRKLVRFISLNREFWRPDNKIN